MATLSGNCCAVCFEPAKLRCSSCAPLGIDLFFCSSDHQKLVWPVHKTVCGSKSGGCIPLLHPPLSDEEARDAQRDLFKVGLPGALEANLDAVLTLREALSELGLKAEQIPGTLEILKRPRHEWAAPVLVFCRNLGPHDIVRTVGYFRAQNSIGTPFYEPFSLLATFNGDFAGNAGNDGFHLHPYNDVWYCTLGHRTVVFCTAVQKKHDELGDGPAFQAYFETVFQAWRTTTLAYVQEMRPRFAKHFEYAVQSVRMSIEGNW
ncbi:hypothetical protein JCM6882_008331 [Rhodosporidiobolus microsporus]